MRTPVTGKAPWTSDRVWVGSLLQSASMIKQQHRRCNVVEGVPVLVSSSRLDHLLQLPNRISVREVRTMIQFQNSVAGFTKLLQKLWKVTAEQERRETSVVQ